MSEVARMTAAQLGCSGKMLECDGGSPHYSRISAENSLLDLLDQSFYLHHAVLNCGTRQVLIKGRAAKSRLLEFSCLSSSWLVTACVSGLGFRVQGLGFRVWGLGFGVLGFWGGG